MDLFQSHEDYLSPQAALTQCPRSIGYYLLNKHTGEFTNATCKSYSCPFCAPRRLFRLRSAIQQVLSSYKHIRMATFTFRTGNLKPTQQHVLQTSEVWRRFLNNIRRDQRFRESQRHFDYIRISELTVNGHIHFHVIISEFLPAKLVRSVWRHAIQTVTGRPGKNGFVKFTHSLNSKSAAIYVSKYVSKAAKEHSLRYRLYSHSKKWVLFQKKEKDPNWVFLNARLTSLNLYTNVISSPDDVKSHIILDVYSDNPEYLTPLAELFEQENNRPPPHHIYYMD